MCTDGSWCRRWCGVASTVSTTAGLGSVEQQSPGDGHVLMDERRAVKLSSAMVASMAARSGKVDAAIQH